MGFFAEIAHEVRQGLPTQPAHPVRTATAPAAPVPFPTPKPPARTASPAPEPVPETPADVPEPQPVHVPEDHVPEPAGTGQAPAANPPKAPGQPEQAPPERPAIDLTLEASAADDDARRKAHEATEAKRKAEFDAKQAEKKAKRQAALDRIAAMDTAELLEAAIGRVAADTERLTRRNMKEAVAERVQARCREDAAFARLAMDPDKSMVNCFKYINRQAQAYAEQEMKDNGIRRTGVYGLDVPDGLVFQWAEDYFNDPKAKEDHEADEKFVPRPYTPARKTSKAKPAKDKPKERKPAPEKPESASPAMDQISLM